MTPEYGALDLGGAVSVLAVWSAVVGFIGVALLIYGVVIVLRDRRWDRRQPPEWRQPAQRVQPVEYRNHALPRELPAAPVRPALESGGRRQPTRPRAHLTAARTRCEQATQVAREVAAAATLATADAVDAYDRYVTAQHLRERAQQARDTANRDAATAERAAAAAERHRDEDEQRREKDTTQAAFAAFRRGDLSADELREVFRRAEGWSPERENLIRTATGLRAEQARAQRELDLATGAERTAAERARVTAVSARALAEDARAAAAAARTACAGLPPPEPRPVSAPPRAGTLRPPVPGPRDERYR